jgi:hypothetical protein
LKRGDPPKVGDTRGAAREEGHGSVLESVAQEVASSGFGLTIIEHGDRHKLRFGGVRVAKLMPIYDQTPAHSFLRTLDPKNGLGADDPKQMAPRIIKSVDLEPGPFRLTRESQAFKGSRKTLCKRMSALKHRPNAPLRGTLRPRRDIYCIFFTRYEHLSKQIIQ